MAVKNVLGPACCLGLLAAAPAPAGNSGTGDPALLLGPIATYATPDATRLACGKGPVAWADRYEGSTDDPSKRKYGRTVSGAYACQRQDATRGNSRDTSPLSSMAGHPGKSFASTSVSVGS